MSEVEWYYPSLDSVQNAVEERYLDGTHLMRSVATKPNHMYVVADDVMTLCYGARMVHDCAVIEEEYDEIMEAARRVEESLGVQYVHDSHYEGDSDE